jgi:hypothetical protein
MEARYATRKQHLLAECQVAPAIGCVPEPCG